MTASVVGLRAGIGAALAAAFALVPSGSAVAAANDGACETVRAVGDSGGVLLDVPAGVRSAPLTPPDASVTQGGLPINVTSVGRVRPQAVDLALVVDTSAVAAKQGDLLRRAALGLVAHLGPGTHIVLVTTGGSPTVAQRLTTDLSATAAVITSARFHGRDATGSAVRLAAGQLPARDAYRQREIVVMSAGVDESWSEYPGATDRLLARRGIWLDSIKLSAGGRAVLRSVPACPLPTTDGDAVAVAVGLAARISARQRLVLSGFDERAALVVELRTPAGNVSVPVEPRPAAAPVGAGAAAAAPTQDGVGAGILLLALLVGLCGLVGFFAMLAGHSHRLGQARAAVGELGECLVVAVREAATPDERRRRPRAERIRRWRNAWHDLGACLTRESSARELAEAAAYAELRIRAAEEERAAAAQARIEAYARAQGRYQRTRERAARLDAEARALLEVQRLTERSVNAAAAPDERFAGDDVGRSLDVAAIGPGSADVVGDDVAGSVEQELPVDEEQALPTGVPVATGPRPGGVPADRSTWREPGRPSRRLRRKVSAASHPRRTVEAPVGAPDPASSPSVARFAGSESPTTDPGPATEPPDLTTAAAGAVLLEQVSESSTAPTAAPDDVQAGAVVGEPAAREPAPGGNEPPRSPARPPLDVMTARAVAVLLVPAAGVARQLSGSSWTVDPVRLSLLVCALALTVVGVSWTWRASRVPHALLGRTARAIVDAQARRTWQAEKAAELLAELRAGTATESSWAAFASWTGLSVPASTRPLIDPGMDPEALVRYLTARQREPQPMPQPLLVVILVPALVCLLPAALIVWSV